MKAIQTDYNGLKFRSRLEARWAVCFDACGIDYQYEPEGLELADGRRWLPDFWLPNEKAYVEVKGDPSALDVRLLRDFAREGQFEIVLLGQVPVTAPWTHYGINRYDETVDVGFWKDRGRLYWVDGGDVPDFDASPGVLLEGRKPLVNFVGDSRAYHMARTARFEFGETPKDVRK